jgi:lipopolysaccharide/colanic/teichoic acid biosynthesis glycosyltransferase
VAWIWIRLDSPGGALFVQERVGLGGRIFRIFKFRTMWKDAPRYANSPGGDRDPRITRIGRFLRRTGLDELPQLLNVIRGEMSIVGPRPEMPFLVDGYNDLQRQRFHVKPGITGLWQVSVDRHAEIHENIEYDLYYISHQSLLLDVLVLFETLFFTLGLLLRPRWRQRDESGDDLAAIVNNVSSEEENVVLLALDQRRGRDTERLWRRWVGPVAELAARRPIKILVASENVAAFDSLLRETGHALNGSAGRLEYVLYESAYDVRALVETSSLVISDLKHVQAWARSASARVIVADHGDDAPDDMLPLPHDASTARARTANLRNVPEAQGIPPVSPS